MRARKTAAVLAVLMRTLLMAAQYPPVEAGYRLSFPRDEGSHPGFRTEWWYLTGFLEDDAGQPLGFQVTFFRTRPGVAEDNPSKFAPRQLLFAHAAVSDARHGHLLRSEKVARVGFGLADAQEGALDVRLDDWRLHRKGDVYETVVSAPQFKLELSLRATRAPLLHGKDGYSRKSPLAGFASYYYSLPQLETKGRVVIADKEYRVRGAAWFDHEWWSTLLDEETHGWDWTGLNLDDGSAVMAMRMRDGKGNERWSFATWSAASDRGTSPRIYEGSDVAWRPLRHWRSSRTGTQFPIEWQLESGDARSMRPLMDDQENDTRGSTGTLYWEGAVRAFDADDRPIGRGYLELTGYGSRLRLDCWTIRKENTRCTMSRIYHEGQRELQRQFDTVRLADRLEQVTWRRKITRRIARSSRAATCSSLPLLTPRAGPIVRTRAAILASSVSSMRPASFFRTTTAMACIVCRQHEA